MKYGLVYKTLVHSSFKSSYLISWWGNSCFSDNQNFVCSS